MEVNSYHKSNCSRVKIICKIHYDGYENSLEVFLVILTAKLHKLGMQ